MIIEDIKKDSITITDSGTSPIKLNDDNCLFSELNINKHSKLYHIFWYIFLFPISFIIYYLHYNKIMNKERNVTDYYKIKKRYSYVESDGTHIDEYKYEYYKYNRLPDYYESSVIEKFRTMRHNFFDYGLILYAIIFVTFAGLIII